MNENKNLSNKFNFEFKEKFKYNRLKITDLLSLNQDCLNELNQHYVQSHIEPLTDDLMIKSLGLFNAIKYYQKYNEDYNNVNDVIKYLYNCSNKFFSFSTFSILDLCTQLGEINDLKEIKDKIYSYTRNIIMTSEFSIILDKVPQDFIKNNDDIFLTNCDISDNIKVKYYQRNLSAEDIINNIKYFKNIPIYHFANNKCSIALKIIMDCLGLDGFYNIANNYKEIFIYILNNYDLNFFSKHFINKTGTPEEKFTKAVKSFYYEHEEIYKSNFPSCFNLLKFSIVFKYTSWSDIQNHSYLKIIRNKDQRFFLEKVNIEYIKRFENETGFFTYYKLLNFDEAASFMRRNFENFNITSYDDFENLMVKIIDNMRCQRLLQSIDFIEGPFREKYPNLFMTKDAPEFLKNVFYHSNITPSLLNDHPEYIPYLVSYDLEKIIAGNFDILMKTFINDYFKNEYINFISFYSKKFGNYELLKLLSEYGSLFNDISRYSFITKNNSTKEEVDYQIREMIYNAIKTYPKDYTCLINNTEFKNSYPGLFIDLSDISSIPTSDKERLINAFYKRELTYDDVYDYPELTKILKDKELIICFGFKRNIFNDITPENFLYLCSKYGKYISKVLQQTTYYKMNELISDYNYDVTVLVEFVEKKITEYIVDGLMSYEDSKKLAFLKEKYPGLFLSNDAPDDLKQIFYSGKMIFDDLVKHPEWLPYLKDKILEPAMMRSVTPFSRPDYNYRDYFRIFGEEVGIKLGMQKPDTVTRIVDEAKYNTMKMWYDKTGKKFIPDYVIMQNIPFEEADKFFSSIKKWSRLMKISSFTETIETKEAMLKLAYSFGVFDNDKSGFKKLEELLIGIPHTLSEKDYSIFKLYIKNSVWIKMEENYYDLKHYLKEENTNIDFSEDIIPQLYKKSGDNYVLAVNPQQHPKSMKYLRKCMELTPVSPLITPTKAHQFFGGFKLEYNPDFREFLLANLDNINEDNSMYISSIQRQFKEIKAINSNRILTFELAINFVKNNKYLNIEIGNEKMAEISSIAGYSQEDFNTLQEIYNYGKLRVFSSIPRIFNKTEKYTYEILRLDDPLALAIGTLSDCCQEIGNAAEVCMEHSMVDANGRIFVIRDNNDNIVSQSWVWRNKDVLCFDNIEIPDKAFKRTELNKEDFAKEVYDIYKQASKELIEEDEKVYKQLLDDGKITEEQYNGLRLGKVTVGLGYNDIASAIKKNAIRDNSILSRPLNFEPPVELNRGLYTSDSTTQYILEERDNRIKYKDPTLSVHNDSYKIYDDSNISIKELYLLNRLEQITLDNYLYTSINEDEPIVATIAENYDLNPYKTKIILHPNFAIIYEDDVDKIILGTLFFNDNITNIDKQIDVKGLIALQIGLALKQISYDKKINVKGLNENQLAMYNLAKEKISEIDKIKGLRH